MLKRAIVVGASSGIGAELVGVLVRHGYLVVAVARREDALRDLAQKHNLNEERVHVFSHDVTETEKVGEVFAKAVAVLEGVDLVVYGAGVMPPVGPDEWSTDKDHHMMKVNLMGAIAWLNLAAERMHQQGKGTIVAIGSVAGDRGRRGQPAYCASKAGLECYVESLRNRLSQHGVTVLTVKPGPVHTPMTEGLETLPMVISAQAAAEQIGAAIRRRKTVVYVPFQWRAIMTVIRMIPSFLFRRLDI